jgi:hypothetical protein
MKTGGVIIDAWKRDIFIRHLTFHGYSYTEHLGPTRGTILLKVTVQDHQQQALAQMCLAANQEAARNRP